ARFIPFCRLPSLKRNLPNPPFWGGFEADSGASTLLRTTHWLPTSRCVTVLTQNGKDGLSCPGFSLFWLSLVGGALRMRFLPAEGERPTKCAQLEDVRSVGAVRIARLLIVGPHLLEPSGHAAVGCVPGDDLGAHLLDLPHDLLG